MGIEVNRGEYAKRDAILKKMGYATYGMYLKSSLWKSIRKRVLERDGHKCVLCGSSATQCHHKFYGKRELTGKKIKHIVSLCRVCHGDIETDDGKPVSWSKTHRRFLQRVERRRIQQVRRCTR